MVFSSLEFIFIFLPLFFTIYIILPDKFRNAFIFLASIIFYAYGTIEHPAYILLIIFSVIINYILGIFIYEFPKFKKFWLSIGLVSSFTCLFLFKYASFFLRELDRFLPIPEAAYDMKIFNLLLPIGISFYTFQAASYIIDVYRGVCRPERSLINFGAYLSMFPQLIAGPIVTYSSVREKLHKRSLSLAALSEGSKLFIFGLGIKVLLANRMGSLWTTLINIGFESVSTPLAWLGITARSFQIYFNFFGYSLMAIGLGHMIGIKFPQNFSHPYLTLTMTDFWRKWHITLGTWFREYLYIPLGGNKRGSLITYRNLLAVWLFTGLWHGASMNFLLWGLSLYVLIAIEKLFLGKILNRYVLSGRIYMLFFIPVTWTILSITELDKLYLFFTRLFPFLPGETSLTFSGDYIKYGIEYGAYILLGFLFSTRLPYRFYSFIKDTAVGGILLLAIFWISVYCMYRGMNDPFLYFRF